MKALTWEQERERSRMARELFERRRLENAGRGFKVGDLVAFDAQNARRQGTVVAVGPKFVAAEYITKRETKEARESGRIFPEKAALYMAERHRTRTRERIEAALGWWRVVTPVEARLGMALDRFAAAIRAAVEEGTR